MTTKNKDSTVILNGAEGEVKDLSEATTKSETLTLAAE